VNRREEIAWAAGLFDGEGTIQVRPNGVWLQMSMVDRDLVERFHRVAGAGGVCTSQRPGSKRLYIWHLGKRAEVQRLLQELLPWFGERRAAKAQEGLDFIATFYRICGADDCDVEFLAGRLDRIYCCRRCYDRTHRAQALQRYYDKVSV